MKLLNSFWFVDVGRLLYNGPTISHFFINSRIKRWIDWKKWKRLMGGPLKKVNGINQSTPWIDWVMELEQPMKWSNQWRVVVLMEWRTKRLARQGQQPQTNFSFSRCARRKVVGWLTVGLPSLLQQINERFSFDLIDSARGREELKANQHQSFIEENDGWLLSLLFL